MAQNILYILGAFVVSAACGFFFIPIILDFCKRRGLYDLPDSRKIHKNAIPRLGGISFLPSMFIAFLVTTLAINHFTGYSQVTFSLWSLYFFISLLLIYSVGLIDDLMGLGAKTKFTVQIVAAVLLPLSGLYINNLYGFMGINEISYAVGAPLTVFIIVFVNNAINLIDGIDGLSASLSLVALTGFLVCFLSEGVLYYGILIAGLMGVLVPFLYFNLFGKPEQNRKIFMGDSGSLTLGFILGFLAVKLAMDNPNVMTTNPDSLILAYTLLVVPVLDVVRVSLVRIRHRTPIFRADKNHIHHKLMRCGLSQHQTLGAILLLALLFIGLNLVLNSLLSSTAVVVADICLWILVHELINHSIRQRGNQVFLAPEPEK
ncbi:MAG: undecaprenyl/decaprenyl-phosphate alpha-N-acetylglucosaminyl 1-phosphate transferase [Prevotella sp.]|nr:undecaprenyl/decaprenyl-phosphate alpha-N-acetylglucosaminyl 1-phosphate transferase [Prevotella sp.]